MSNYKRFKLTVLFLMATGLMLISNVQAKTLTPHTVYMFGFAASFTDSIVHFTEIQKVDSAWIESKTKFLKGRDNYSYQLRDYLSQKQQLPHRTCIVVYDKDCKKLEKKYLKMKRQYSTSSKNNFDIRVIAPSNFQFRTVDMSFTNQEEVAEEKPSKRSEGGRKTGLLTPKKGSKPRPEPKN